MAYTDIDKPSDYFNTVTYTGNGTAIGSGGNAITGVGFQPDWVWIKDRTSTNNHNLFDVVRGVTKGLQSSSTIAEYTNTETVSTFDSDGFTVGNAGGLNTNTNNYVSWNWLTDNTSGSSNTDGSITSTVSASTTSGFSIVSYTATGSATNFGHGLGVAPSVVIIKDRNGTAGSGWLVGHTAIGMTNYLKLNTTAASTNNTDVYSQNASSSLVYIGTSAAVNESGKNYICYCFAEKQGYSKFGSYVGNGSTDGTFVYTGFKPAFLITKMYNTTGGSWGIVDGTRNEFNVVNKWNFADSSGAEFSAVNVCDFLSNGFKFRAADTSSNSSGNSYIYMAFAEEPLVGDNPATAR